VTSDTVLDATWAASPAAEAALEAALTGDDWNESRALRVSAENWLAGVAARAVVAAVEPAEPAALVGKFCPALAEVPLVVPNSACSACSWELLEIPEVCIECPPVGSSIPPPLAQPGGRED